jgi:LPS O-antigen subunit length determinant protein (WzzB/FepE family)
MSRSSHSEPVRNQADDVEDEIELIDLFRVVWKWKYLITGGTIVCAIAALVISLMLPKIYRIETLMQPGVLRINEDGSSVFIDTPDNIKALIENGIFDFKILSNLNNSMGSDVSNALNIKVTLARSSNSLKIYYETSQIDRGIEILDLLGKFLTEEYSSYVKFFQNEIEKKLNIARAEIQKNKSIKQSNEKNIYNIEKRIHELETGIVFVNENTAYLYKERNRLLLKDKDESNILTAILYSNTIQQNLQLENKYKNDIKDLKFEKETELQNISELENMIQMQRAEIDNLEYKKNNIQNIRIMMKPHSSPNPIKPKKMINVILAVFVGIFAMIFLAFLLEYISRNKDRKYILNDRLSGSPPSKK